MNSSDPEGAEPKETSDGAESETQAEGAHIQTEGAEDQTEGARCEGRSAVA